MQVEYAQLEAKHVMLQGKFREKERAFVDMGQTLAKTAERITALEEKEREEKSKVSGRRARAAASMRRCGRTTARPWSAGGAPSRSMSRAGLRMHALSRRDGAAESTTAARAAASSAPSAPTPRLGQPCTAARLPRADATPVVRQARASVRRLPAGDPGQADRAVSAWEFFSMWPKSCQM